MCNQESAYSNHELLVFLKDRINQTLNKQLGYCSQPLIQQFLINFADTDWVSDKETSGQMRTDCVLAYHRPIFTAPTAFRPAECEANKHS